MSKYIELLNKIKENCTEEWLSHSQKTIFDKIAGGFKTHKLVNIYGDSGIGKTFIGWIFQKSLNYIYINNINDIPEYEYVVLDDNLRFKREETRILRPILMVKKIETMILITQKKIRDDVPCLCLKLDNDDINEIFNNLYMNLNIQILKKEGSEYNLRNLIIKNIK